jgi:hypothetical protein
MFVRPESVIVVRGGSHDPWELVARSQKANAAAGFLIPQPAHSALSGDIAAKLSPEHFPGVEDETLCRCIALHDTGWSGKDAQQIATRDSAGFRPKSFMQESPSGFLPAWTASIDAVEKINLAGGYMVSRHFESLGAEQCARYEAKEKQQIEDFRHREEERQRRLAADSGKGPEELEALVEANRFCDLLSLLFCANVDLAEGAAAHFKQNARHPSGYTIKKEANGFAFEGASPFREPAEFHFSGVAFGAGKSGGGWFSVTVR